MLTDENQLIREIIKGDKDKFRLLLNEYKNLIYSLIVKQVGNFQDAEELTQEVFSKAYFNLHTFKFEAKFSTWLYRIAINTTNSYFTSRVYKERKRTTNFEVTLHQMKTTDSENSHVTKEEVSLFQIALGKLKPIFRDVLVLCALEGHSYEEVATMLDIPIGTVRSRLNSARLSIKTEMVNLGKEV